MHDIRDDIFRDISDKKVIAFIRADDDGIIVEMETVKSASGELGLDVSYSVENGSPVRKGDIIIQFSGNPKQIAMAGDLLIGLMAKASGITTAAHCFVEKAGPSIQVVSGAWKKIHISQKEIVRRAIAAGGAEYRICREPFLYIDKNYLVMLGGIRECLVSIKRLSGYKKVIQIAGTSRLIELEASEAAEYGADVIFIDSGDREDITTVSKCLVREGKRNSVKLAFGGNIKLEDMEAMRTLDVDILDIGRSIIDAPLLDMKMEIL
ncbi:MAG: hypothetical protein PHU23_19670 [Dehalococcoidales bacterium]|nr:hypothetical protein [Dehalococcoidales bacterium]